MNLFKKFQWRYAVKNYDPTKKVDQKLVDQIIKATRITHSSSDSQPLQVIEITSRKAKEDIMRITNNQHQVVDCSHLLVFASWDNSTENNTNYVFDFTTPQKNQTVDTHKKHSGLFTKKHLNSRTTINLTHATFQTYLSFGFAIAMATELKVDSTPMDGFDKKALDTYLNLKQRGLRSASILCLGYRDETDDLLVDLKKGTSSCA